MGSDSIDTIDHAIDTGGAVHRIARQSGLATLAWKRLRACIAEDRGEGGGRTAGPTGDTVSMEPADYKRLQ